MPVLQGEQLDALHGPLIRCAATLHPSETMLGAPVSVPTSEPGTSQVSYTVASGHLPTWDIVPGNMSYTPLVLAAGYSPTAGTLYYRTLKNSTSVATGSKTLVAATYWTFTAGYYGAFPNNLCAVGDTLELRFWSSASDTDWRYHALVLLPTRMLWGGNPVSFMAIRSSATLGLSYGSAGGSNDMQLTFAQYYPTGWIMQLGWYSPDPNAWTYLYGWNPHQTYGINILQPDRWPEVYFYTHATSCPRYRAPNWIRYIAYRAGAPIVKETVA